MWPKVSPTELNRVIAHPADMYRTARRSRRRIREWIRQLRDAEIAEREFSESSDSTQAFMPDYNAFVQRTRVGYEQLDGFLNRAETPKAPIVRFVRAVRTAITARDASAYQAARNRYVRTLRQVGDRWLAPRRWPG
jgi:hypothetical protein